LPDEPAYKRRLREYAKGDLHADHLSALEEELHGTSDRAAAILYAALVENALVCLIDKQLRPDLNSSDRRDLRRPLRSRTPRTFDTLTQGGGLGRPPRFTMA
jgi:hypothetical protein